MASKGRYVIMVIIALLPMLMHGNMVAEANSEVELIDGLEWEKEVTPTSVDYYYEIEDFVFAAGSTVMVYAGIDASIWDPDYAEWELYSPSGNQIMEWKDEPDYRDNHGMGAAVYDELTFKVPCFPSEGRWEIVCHFENDRGWDQPVGNPVKVHWYFHVGESTIWDNLCAPFYLYIGQMGIWPIRIKESGTELFPPIVFIGAIPALLSPFLFYRWAKYTYKAAKKGIIEAREEVSKEWRK